MTLEIQAICDRKFLSFRRAPSPRWLRHWPWSLRSLKHLCFFSVPRILQWRGSQWRIQKFFKGGPSQGYGGLKSPSAVQRQIPGKGLADFIPRRSKMLS